MNKITRRTLLAGASIGLVSSRVWAQAPSEVKVGLLVLIGAVVVGFLALRGFGSRTNY
jgi:branched-chain amino acid transport system substrate-binding protein